MRFASLDQLGIDPARLFVLAILCAVLGGSVVWLLVGDLLGSATSEFELVVSGLVFYIVVSAPRRLIGARRVSQARESVLLSSVSAVSSRVVGSRNRVLLLMRASDEELRNALAWIGRSLLLGLNAEDTVCEASATLSSYSASNALRRMGTESPNSPIEGGEETRGLESAGQMATETKLPVFMTVCFFTPIMLLLYAVFSHLVAPQRLAELVALEMVILDLAFYVCS